MRTQDFYRDYRQRYVCDGTNPALASTSQNATRNNFIEAVKNRVKDVRLLRYQNFDGLGRIRFNLLNASLSCNRKSR